MKTKMMIIAIFCTAMLTQAGNGWYTVEVQHWGDINQKMISATGVGMVMPGSGHASLSWDLADAEGLVDPYFLTAPAGGEILAGIIGSESEAGSIFSITGGYYSLKLKSVTMEIEVNVETDHDQGLIQVHIFSRGVYQSQASTEIKPTMMGIKQDAMSDLGIITKDVDGNFSVSSYKVRYELPDDMTLVDKQYSQANVAMTGSFDMGFEVNYQATWDPDKGDVCVYRLKSIQLTCETGDCALSTGYLLNGSPCENDDDCLAWFTSRGTCLDGPGSCTYFWYLVGCG